MRSLSESSVKKLTSCAIPKPRDNEVCKHSLPCNPNPEDEDFILDAIIYDKFSIPPFDDPETAAKTRLRNECENATLGVDGEKYVCGNPRGRSLLDNMHVMIRRVETLESKDMMTRGQIGEMRDQIGEMRDQIGEHEKEIIALKGKVGRLSQECEGFRCIRRRFLDIYRRDVKDDQALKGSPAIKAGNAKAHEGDALADAALFEHDHRTDTRLYRDLYGLEYRQVLELGDSGVDDGGIFLVLNAHATRLAQGKPLSDDVKKAFECFLIEVEANWLQAANKEQNSPLWRAYFDFWGKFRAQGQ